MWHSPVFVAFGSNLGNKGSHIAAARDALGADGDIVVERFSSLYRSRAMYNREQPDFLNAVCRCKTTLSPARLLERLKALERRLGRVEAKHRYAPRVIDMDLLYYGQRVLLERGLVIPHPRRAERAFVLLPLVEIAPSFCDPKLGCSVAELAKQLEREGTADTLEKVQEKRRIGQTDP